MNRRLRKEAVNENAELLSESSSEACKLAGVTVWQRKFDSSSKRTKSRGPIHLGTTEATSKKCCKNYSFPHKRASSLTCESSFFELKVPIQNINQAQVVLNRNFQFETTRFTSQGWSALVWKTMVFAALFRRGFSGTHLNRTPVTFAF